MSMLIPLNLIFGALPEGFTGTPDEFRQALQDRAQLFFPDSLYPLVVTNGMPTSNLGPWLSPEGIIYLWDYTTGSYQIASGFGKVKVDAADTLDFLGTKIKNTIIVDAEKLQLSGDILAPGNSMYYGTNATGVKGWNNFPSHGFQVISANGNFTVPANVTLLKVETIGGGGGGGSASSSGGVNNIGAAGGGGNGSSVVNTLVVTPGQVIAVVIGAAGTAGTGGGNGGNGGQTSFNGSFLAAGGIGGGGAAPATGQLAGQSGPGAGMSFVTTTTGASGYGANSPYGTGGIGKTSEGIGGNASGFGSGGGGGLRSSSGSFNGGTATAGVCVVSW